MKCCNRCARTRTAAQTAHHLAGTAAERKAGASLSTVQSTVLITGAAGGVGTLMRPRLARPGRVLRLLDIAPLDAGPGEEAVRASVTDLAAVTEACRGADAVIHLGGRSLEAPWERILETNIDGT